MTQTEWHDIYRKRIKEQLECTDEQAFQILEAGLDDFDYLDNPIEAADEELSYWTD